MRDTKLLAAWLSLLLLAPRAGAQSVRHALPAAPAWLRGERSPSGLAWFERSAWVDATLNDSSRGYWIPVPEMAPVARPSASQVQLAKEVLRRHYAVNQLYLLYHRELEPAQAMALFRDWRDAPILDDWAPFLVPTLVLQDYAGHGCNFSDAEVMELAAFFRDEINRDAIAVYDIYDTSQDPRRGGCGQLDLIARTHGGTLVRVGLQPGEPLVAPFGRGVEDTYGAVGRARDNALWSAGCGGDGEASARALLARWVAERSGRERVSWDLVAVGMDYTRLSGCGAETLANDPVPAGRNRLAHDVVVDGYPGGSGNATWTGFSTDLRILHVNSAGREPWDESFYGRLRQGRAYAGLYAGALEEIRQIYWIYNLVGPASPRAAVVVSPLQDSVRAAPDRIPRPIYSGP